MEKFRLLLELTDQDGVLKEFRLTFTKVEGEDGMYQPIFSVKDDKTGLEIIAKLPKAAYAGVRKTLDDFLQHPENAEKFVRRAVAFLSFS